MSRIKDFFTRTTSSRALDAGTEAEALTVRAKTKTVVTHKAGKRGKPFRRIVDYQRSGPFYRQVGIRWLHGESWPIMQTFFIHRFLHATKGWRVYTGDAVMRLPQPGGAGVSPRLTFYGRPHL